MPNPIGRNEAKQSHETRKNGAEITGEMQSRLMLGETATEPHEDDDPSLREDTVAGRAAAAPRPSRRS